jgi:hypothetical protein
MRVLLFWQNNVLKKYMYQLGRLSFLFRHDITKYLSFSIDHIKFSVDEKSVLNIMPPLDGGFWMVGGFSKDFADNIYHSGSVMAPFDQQVSEKFYKILI